MRKTILTAIIVSICLFSCSTDQKSESVKPNIILVFTDDFGYGDMGAMFQNKRGEENKRNNPWAFTPKLDILAQEGLCSLNNIVQHQFVRSHGGRC